MRQNAQPIRTQSLTAIMSGVAGVGFAMTATASGGGVGVNANAIAGAAVASPGYVQAGGTADAHMNAYLSAITNVQWQSEVTRGADRAADRTEMDSDGLAPSATAEPEATGKTAALAKHPGTR